MTRADEYLKILTMWYAFNFTDEQTNESVKYLDKLIEIGKYLSPKEEEFINKYGEELRGLIAKYYDKSKNP